MSEPLSPLAPDAIKALAAMMVANDPTVQPNHTGALVVVVNVTHLELAVATRLGKGWTVDLKARYAWNGDRKVEGMIKRTW